MMLPRSLCCLALLISVCAEDSAPTASVSAPKILSVERASVQSVSTSTSSEVKSESKSPSVTKVNVQAFSADGDSASVKIPELASSPDILRKEAKGGRTKVTVSVFEAEEPREHKKIFVQKTQKVVVEPPPIYTQFLQAYQPVYQHQPILKEVAQPLTSYAVAYQPQPQQIVQQAYQHQQPAYQEVDDLSLQQLQSLEYYPTFGMRIFPGQQELVNPYTILGYPQPQVQQQQPQEQVYQEQVVEQPQPQPVAVPAGEQPQYNFAYRVHDSVSGTNHGHTEVSRGGVVHGRYAVMDPDGMLRTVAYTSDPVAGFNAVVNRVPMSQNQAYSYRGSQQSGNLQGYHSYL